MTAPLILIAHEEQTVRDAAVHAVQSAGYEAIAVTDGVRALEVLVAEPTPAALVVDVGLQGLAGYELVDEIKQRGLPTRVVLISSVYSKTAYKRSPTSLYGADDYVEQHHVVDMLAPKLAELVPAPITPPQRSVHGPAGLPPEVRRESEAMRERADRRLAMEAVADDPVGRARELARIVVADLVLYNGTEVETWLRNRSSGGDQQLPSRVLTDLDEARRLLAMAVPADVSRGRDFVLEALMSFLEGRG